MAKHAHTHTYPSLPIGARAKAITDAEALAKARNMTLTPQRRTVFELLLKAGRPLGAYMLMDELSKKEERGIAPPTIYRALDFLVELGVVSRLESSNEFVPCAHPSEPHDCIFLICTCCKKATEVDDKDVHKSLMAIAESNNFQTGRRVV